MIKFEKDIFTADTNDNLKAKWPLDQKNWDVTEEDLPKISEVNNKETSEDYEKERQQKIEEARAELFKVYGRMEKEK
ncbi:TPA: hypothetical protein ACGO2A_000894 [Streptococcus suis]|uniref:hypothetical protein n=1 Tax=Streptococcus suis TaxID=1307 RepID=UPI000CF5C8A6|nr:hypothetical protein [Streptococcus suis]MBY4955543.1 hypothetical protein [Streptococcus suis]MBY4970273.1 hypothetical protein [Streptococcus suis]MBY5016750.1 hypothetical protein [Streptococcus suis]NQJ69949.1 hypothetical protein [Streptococcus suis]NQJ73300.1 hypothetical protein [Streptococcus suis]